MTFLGAGAVSGGIAFGVAGTTTVQPVVQAVVQALVQRLRRRENKPPWQLFEQLLVQPTTFVQLVEQTTVGVVQPVVQPWERRATRVVQLLVQPTTVVHLVLQAATVVQALLFAQRLPKSTASVPAVKASIKTAEYITNLLVV